MKNIENENEDLVQSQKSLLAKLYKINRAFNIHFQSLGFFLMAALVYSFYLFSLFMTGQITPTLAQRYGVFGIVINIIQVVVLLIMFIYFIYQNVVYYSFIRKGNRSIRKIKESHSNIYSFEYKLHHGIVSYVNNVTTFFKRYSKEKKNMRDLVTIFLFANFLFGLYIIIIIFSLVEIEETAMVNSPFMAIFFLMTVISWLVSFGSSFKIRKNFIIWEKIIPKLDSWAQDLEDLPSNTSKSSEILEDEQKKNHN